MPNVRLSAFDGQSVPTKEGWQELWDLCDSVEDIAGQKAPTPAAKAAILKVDTSGGFTVTRARKRARNLIGALGQFPENYSVLGQTKAELVATLRAGVEADEAKARKKSALKGAQQELRDGVAALDTASDSLLILLRASYRKGSPERAVIDRSLGAHHTTEKKEVEQPEEKPA